MTKDQLKEIKSRKLTQAQADYAIAILNKQYPQAGKVWFSFGYYCYVKIGLRAA